MSGTRKLALFGLVVVGAAAIVGAQARPNVRPKDGDVPNATTAVVIGVAVPAPW